MVIDLANDYFIIFGIDSLPVTEKLFKRNLIKFCDFFLRISYIFIIQYSEDFVNINLTIIAILKHIFDAFADFSCNVRIVHRVEVNTVNAA